MTLHGQEGTLGKDLEMDREMVVHLEAVAVHQTKDYVQDVDRIHVYAVFTVASTLAHA